jgi:hypothetical protein
VGDHQWHWFGAQPLLWTSEIWLLPYLLFWLWVIIVASGSSLVTIGVCSADAGEQTVIRAQESAQGCGGQLGLAVLWLACGAPDCLGELGVADGVGAGGVD